MARRDNRADSIAETLKKLYDQYGYCAGRYFEVLSYIQKTNAGRLTTHEVTHGHR